MTGQLSDAEFRAMYARASVKSYNFETGIAMIKFGKSTINLYRQHSDGSWTNFHCYTQG